MGGQSLTEHERKIEELKAQIRELEQAKNIKAEVNVAPMVDEETMSQEEHKPKMKKLTKMEDTDSGKKLL